MFHFIFYVLHQLIEQIIVTITRRVESISLYFIRVLRIAFTSIEEIPR